MNDDSPLKPVIWVGTSLRDLREFPAAVQDLMGYALYGEPLTVFLLIGAALIFTGNLMNRNRSAEM